MADNGMDVPIAQFIRNRIFWLAGDSAKLSEENMSEIKLPGEFVLACQKQHPCILEITRASDKAWPGTVLFEDGVSQP